VLALHLDGMPIIQYVIRVISSAIKDIRVPFVAEPIEQWQSKKWLNVMLVKSELFIIIIFAIQIDYFETKLSDLFTTHAIQMPNCLYIKFGKKLIPSMNMCVPIVSRWHKVDELLP
jgi:hypothetical protein